MKRLCAGAFRAVLAVAAVLALALGPAPVAWAAEAAPTDYTYTVTLYPGNKGTLSEDVVSASGGTVAVEGGVVVVRGLKLGDTVSFFPGEAQVTDGRYYARGVRMGGIDNDDPDPAKQIKPSFKVEGDRDFVMAYGIAGDLVSYTVEFVDEQGNALAPARTYYGNVGDSPVVAHLYVEGYQPEAYNVTKTLVADESQNVLRLVYHPLAALTAGTGTAQGAAGGTNAAAGTDAAGAAAAAAGADGAAGAADGGAAAAAAAQPAEALTDDGTPLAEPQELMNIDDDETPQAQLPVSNRPEQGAAILMAVVSVLSVVALLAALFWIVSRRRRRDDDAAPTA